MKIVSLGPDAIFYRNLIPEWAFLPLSGAGAASEGGRFNCPGVEAGGTNLVLFHSNFTASDQLQVHDPGGRLPQGPVILARVKSADSGQGGAIQGLLAVL